VRLVGWYKADLAKRLLETKRLFARKVLAVDIHSHSYFSDGRGSVQENYEAAQNAGLDFIFMTDHARIGQKRATRKWSDASWGQEPGAGGHHIGLLEGRKLFLPRRDSIAADVARARKIAPFVFIPHPVGWYPSQWYSDELIESLWTLGNEFAMETINGANKVVRGYDQFDCKAVTVWDRLLCDGRRVTALAGSDAHSPDDIGSTWTGVFSKRCAASAIIKSLNAGNCFATEASLLDFSADGKPMGSALRKRKGGSVRLSFRVADAKGIASVRLVSGGKVVREFQAGGDAVCDGGLTRKVGARPQYYRLESTAADDRRAFSTPIYIEPM